MKKVNNARLGGDKTLVLNKEETARETKKRLEAIDKKIADLQAKKKSLEKARKK